MFLRSGVTTGEGALAFLGSHCILELYECPSGLLNDVAHIRAALRQAAIEARSTLLQEVQHTFEPHGVTALALLAESHISVHTWPEAGYAAADVFTCGEETLPEKACEHLVSALQARRFNLKKVERGLATHIEASSTPTRPAEPTIAPAASARDAQENERCRVLELKQTSG